MSTNEINRVFKLAIQFTQQSAITHIDSCRRGYLIGDN